MRYIIAGKLIYYPDNATLSLLVSEKEDIEEQVMNMSPILNRLFLLLLTERGTILSREYMLQKLWDDYGKEGSMNTLNQYISVLRNILKKHIEVDTIIRVPNTGIVFNSEIEVLEKNDVDNSDSLENENREIKTNKLTKKNKIKQSINSFLIIISVVIFSISGFQFTKKNLTSSSPIFDIGMIDNCKVYSIINYSNDIIKNNALTNARNISINNNLPCTENMRYLFYANPNSLINLDGSYSMLSRCSDNNLGFDSCITIHAYR